jgi:aminomethyltransferase
MTVSSSLHRTPFHDFHVSQGAKMVEFASWQMPMLYGSIIEEHRQVRTSGGLFDVSHMGRLRFRGPEAARFLDRLCTRAVQSMAEGQCRYSLICNDAGGCHDDVLVYCLGAEDFIVVCNAANRLKLLDYFETRIGGNGLEMIDETLETGMLAVQGPKVMGLAGQFLPAVTSLKRYRFLKADFFGAEVLVSRTGYTGEDGLELILPAEAAARTVGVLHMGLGTGLVKPAGLGARDTLRLEAGMPLYGHEISEELDPLSAGLTFAVKLDKDDFVGKKALERIASEVSTRILMGLLVEGRRTARQGMPVTHGGAEVGQVTSACLSPTLDRPIAMAYLDRARAEPGGRVTVDLGRVQADAEVVKLPFYKMG